MDTLLINSQYQNTCLIQNGSKYTFPCDVASAIELVSLSIGAGGLALIFVVYLYWQVRAYFITKKQRAKWMGPRCVPFQARSAEDLFQYCLKAWLRVFHGR